MGVVAPIEVPPVAHLVPTVRGAGVDTIRHLYRADPPGHGRQVFDLDDEHRAHWIPSHGLLAVEGQASGEPKVLASLADLGASRARVDQLVAPFGAEYVGVSRADLAVDVAFGAPGETRAFLSGMAAIDLPRCETTRRGSPPHSVWWTGAKSAGIRARCYDPWQLRGGEAFESVRLEDQRRFSSGGRPDVYDLADTGRDRWRSRFDPIRRAVDGVTAASLPVLARALADEARYGYRTAREVERLAGAMVILSGGAGEAYSRRTMYRRRSELRDAGYVVCDDLVDVVKVDLGEAVDAAMEADW